MTTQKFAQAWQLSEMPLHKLVVEGRKVRREDCKHAVRIAVLGDAATQHYCEALASVMKLRGVWPDIYESEFDTIRQEVLDPSSGFHAYRPEFVVLFTVVQSLQARFIGAKNKEQFAEAMLSEMIALWGAISAQHKAVILQHNFAAPLDRSYGNQTVAYGDTFAGAVSKINARLNEHAAAGRIRIVDNDFQAGYYGRRDWFDERLWCQARQGLSPKFLPPLLKSVSDTILCEIGLGTVKCVIVDLDNTVWGGILGDDGIENIEIGQTEVGLVFLRFQQMLLELKRRGILLAVCSKNHNFAVLDVIDNHPDMLLRRSDFVAIVANYDDKVSNLMSIKERLNLGFDSFVFLDDTPFERDIVRSALPEIQVPELPEDPAGVVVELARLNLFEGRATTSEDRTRLEYYRADIARDELKAKFGGLDDYLRELAMEANILPFNSFTLPRVRQLVQRSNQFNLTTIRYNDRELAAVVEDPDASTFCVQLQDRLGDNGIIASLILRKRGVDMIVDTWIMSCRVLGRQVEEFIVQEMVARAVEARCSCLVGRYIPTAKNGLVENLYPRLGFLPAERDGDARLYYLDVDGYQATPHHIRFERVQQRSGRLHDGHSR